MRGRYHYLGGFNVVALLALGLGALPNLPGFLHAAGAVGDGVFPAWTDTVYTYAWFVGFGLAGLVYLVVMSLLGARYMEAPAEVAS